MTQSILYGEFHIRIPQTQADTPFVHGYILVRDDTTGQIIRSYEGLATGTDGHPRPIGISPDDLIKVYPANTVPTTYSDRYPTQLLYTGSTQDVNSLLQLADQAAVAINAHNIGYPQLGVIPTGDSLGVSNSNSVVSSLLHIMGLSDPGPTTGVAPGRGVLLFPPGEENAIRNYYGFPSINQNADAIFTRENYNYNLQQEDSNGNQIYNINYNGGGTPRITITGNASDLWLDNSNITFSANSSATIHGSGNQIDLPGNSGVRAGIFGQGDTITGDSGNNVVTLAGDGTSAIVNGGGLVALSDNNQSLTLGSSGSTVNVGAGLSGESITGSGSTVNTLGAISGSNIFGNSDTLNFVPYTASGLGFVGTGETVYHDGGNTAFFYSNGATATVNGPGTVMLNGSNEGLVLGSGGALVATANGTSGENIFGSGGTFILAPGTTANVSGNGDNIALQGNSAVHVGIFGQNETVTGDSGSNVVNLGGDGTFATVYGGGYAGLTGNNERITLANAGSVIATAPGVQGETITGSNDIISLAANTNIQIYGSGNNINGEDGGDTIGINGMNSSFLERMIF